MVIAHLLSSLQIGGQERVALELAALQRRAGHDVTVVSLAPPPDGPLAEAFRARDVKVERVARGGAGNFGVGVDLTLTPRLVAFLRQRRFGVVHTHNRMPLIYGAPAARVAGAVVVHTRHGPGRGKPREQWLRRAAGRFLHAYVAVSPELATLARELGDCADAKLSVIENGIDLERFRRDDDARRATRAALGIPADAWVVGSVGRLAVEKNYPLLVRAMEPELRRGARLVIVGDGVAADAIRAEAARLGVSDAVILPGATNDTAPYYAALDVFALSSDMEGLPLVSLEAMSAGLPVVSTAVGGLPNLLTDGQTGYLVPKGDADAMSARFAALRADPAGAAAVGERGRAHARARYAREVMTERYLALYARCGARA
jgi:glycosyltransferase involved in cell wall biosynthesis